MISLSILASSNPLDHVVPHTLFEVGSVSVSNHMLMTVVAGTLMLATFLLVFRRCRMVPSGVQNFFESICVYFREEVARPVLHEHTDRFIPFIWTAFFFILFSNLLGMVPLGSILYLVVGLPFGMEHLKEVYGTATGSIYVTGALAGLTFIAIHIGGISNNVSRQRASGRSLPLAAVLGFFVYWYKIVPHIAGITGILLFPLLFFLEFLGAVVKSFALAIRLFANMIAGHIVLAVLLLFITLCKTVFSGIMVGSISVLGSVAISCLELFVAFLQAYIFAFLSTLFIGMAVHQEH